MTWIRLHVAISNVVVVFHPTTAVVVDYKMRSKKNVSYHNNFKYLFIFFSARKEGRRAPLAACMYALNVQLVLAQEHSVFIVIFFKAFNPSVLHLAQVAIRVKVN